MTLRFPEQQPWLLPGSPSRRSIRDNSVTSHRDARDNARSAAPRPVSQFIFVHLIVSPSFLPLSRTLCVRVCLHVSGLEPGRLCLSYEMHDSLRIGGKHLIIVNFASRGPRTMIRPLFFFEFVGTSLDRSY